MDPAQQRPTAGACLAAVRGQESWQSRRLPGSAEVSVGREVGKVGGDILGQEEVEGGQEEGMAEERADQKVQDLWN